MSHEVATTPSHSLTTFLALPTGTATDVWEFTTATGAALSLDTSDTPDPTLLAPTRAGVYTFLVSLVVTTTTASSVTVTLTPDQVTADTLPDLAPSALTLTLDLPDALTTATRILTLPALTLDPADTTALTLTVTPAAGATVTLPHANTYLYVTRLA